MLPFLNVLGGWLTRKKEHPFKSSKPSLKFVKKILRFSLFRPRFWEENSTKTHEQQSEKCSMATGGN